MNRIIVNIPSGTNGLWSIKKATGKWEDIIREIHEKDVETDGRYEPDGTYTFLFHEIFGTIMQDTTHEYLEHQPLWDNASGDILIAGLGIGMVNYKLIENPNVTSVTIVENSQEVIDLVWDHCPKDNRFSLIKENIETWIPSSNFHWNYGWFDSWVTFNPLTQNQYQELMQNKYGSYCDAIGVWKQIY